MSAQYEGRIQTSRGWERLGQGWPTSERNAAPPGKRTETGSGVEPREAGGSKRGESVAQRAASSARATGAENSDAAAGSTNVQGKISAPAKATGINRSGRLAMAMRFPRSRRGPRVRRRGLRAARENACNFNQSREVADVVNVWLNRRKVSGQTLASGALAKVIAASR